MGQKHNINPNQLTMFERAGDLANPDKTSYYDFDEYPDPDEGDFQTFDEFKSHKLNQSKSSPEDYTHRPLMRRPGQRSHYESIQQEGVREPVELTSSAELYGDTGTPNKVLMEGHHRVFAQADIDPDALVPVKWD